jgi:hypothetical protein
VQGEQRMKVKNILFIGLIVILIVSLIMLNFINEPPAGAPKQSNDNIVVFSQGMYTNLHLTEDNITISHEIARVNDNINIRAEVTNLGTVEAEFRAVLYLEHDGIRIELSNQSNRKLPDGEI